MDKIKVPKRTEGEKGLPNVSGKSRRALSYRAMMGGQAGVSLDEQLQSAGRFLSKIA